MSKHNLIIATLFCVALSAGAGPITTNTGFLGTFSGLQNGDLNVASAQVFFDGVNYDFTSTLSAAVGTTTGVDYIWGVDRGLAPDEAGFGAFAPGVLFDSVVILSDSGGVGSGFVDDIFNGGTITPLSAGAVTINGDTISAIVPGSLLTGNVLPGGPLVNLWPSLGIPGPLTDIAEFAPGDFDASTTTPEPSSLALMGLGLIGVAAMTRLRKRA
jgi:hypothetical protein